jgi:hypothetical protein
MKPSLTSGLGRTNSPQIGEAFRYDQQGLFLRAAAISPSQATYYQEYWSCEHDNFAQPALSYSENQTAIDQALSFA